MYEIAGEDVIKMDPIHENHTSFPMELKKFLFQSDGIIIMASSQSVRSDEEEILQDFLEYLIRNKLNIPICFILTKYDLVKETYSNHVEASQAIYENIINLLLEYEESEVLPFSIGIVEDKEIVKDESEQYCSEIFNWIEKV
jgi:GTPase SAR1 family protein